MKIAIIGSRSLIVEKIENYLPENITEIVSGGATGIDCCARDYAKANKIKLTEFLPPYDKYPGRIAPLMRNDEIISYADAVIAFWDGKSRGTSYMIKKCREMSVPCRVFKIVI